MADYKILERNFSETFLSTEGRSFFEGAIHSQIVRAYQSSYFLANETESSATIYLYDLIETPYPQSQDVIPPEENPIRQITLFLATTWIALRDLWIAQPYNIDGDSYYWGESTGEEDVPYIAVSPPEGFYTLMPLNATLSFLLGTGPPPDIIKYQENWKSVVDMLLGTLKIMDLLFSTEINAVFEDIENRSTQIGAVGDWNYARPLIQIAGATPNISYEYRQGAPDIYKGPSDTFLPGDRMPPVKEYGNTIGEWQENEASPTDIKISSRISGSGGFGEQYLDTRFEILRPPSVKMSIYPLSSSYARPNKIWDHNGDYAGASGIRGTVDSRAKINLSVGGTIRFNVDISGLSFTQGMCEKITVIIGSTTKTYDMPRDIDSESFTEITESDYNVAIKDTFSLTLGAGEYDCSIVATMTDQYPPESVGIGYTKRTSLDLTNSTAYNTSLNMPGGGCSWWNLTYAICGQSIDQWWRLEGIDENLGYDTAVYYSPRIEDQIFAKLSIVDPE
jgi:hypothetical protein